MIESEHYEFTRFTKLLSFTVCELSQQTLALLVQLLVHFSVVDPEITSHHLKVGMICRYAKSSQEVLLGEFTNMTD